MDHFFTSAVLNSSPTVPSFQFASQVFKSLPNFHCVASTRVQFFQVKEIQGEFLTHKKMTLQDSIV